MGKQLQQTIKGLIVWVDTPFILPETRTSTDDQVIKKWKTKFVPDIEWDLRELPVLPLLSIDPTDRLDRALPKAEVWLSPQPKLDTSHHTIQKFAGDLEHPKTLWLDWDDVIDAHNDPDKRFMLETSTYLADNGIVLLLVPNADGTFLRLWQHYISHIIYNAREVYAIGPGGFDWPAPIQWLADSVDSARAHIERILADSKHEITEPTIDLERFIGLPGDDEMHEAIIPDDDIYEETPRMAGHSDIEDTTLRLDTAVPENVFLGEIFDLAVAVRQVISPILQEQDLTYTQSGDIQVKWREGQDTIQLRIEVSAPTCEIIDEPQAKFHLRYGDDSPIFYFHLSPKRLGSLSIIVKVYQEDFWLGSARIRTWVKDEPVGYVETRILSHKLALTHTGLEIRIGSFDNNLAGYPVEAELSNGSHFDDGVFALDESVLHTISYPMDYGEYLWEKLFIGPIHDAYLAASATAVSATEGRLRIRLWIDDDASSLHAIVWERLLNRHHTPPQPVSISAKQPFSRYLGIRQSAPEPIRKAPIRILLVVSNPPDLDNLPSLDVESEINNILAVIENNNRIRLTVLAGENSIKPDLKTRLLSNGHTLREVSASLENITRLLTKGESVHILHIIAHGRFVKLRGASELYLQDNDGFTKITSDRDITLRLGAVSTLPHMVFLAACESANRHPGNQNAYVGLAPKLLTCGVPAVVAMQDMLPIDAAQKLTRDFYTYLLQHGVVDRALAQARLLLFDPASKVWSTPVLYMRLKDGVLFNLENE